MWVIKRNACYSVLLLLLLSTHLAQGADYVREKKWADEITPGIVVGDPVYLEEKPVTGFSPSIPRRPMRRRALSSCMAWAFIRIGA